MEFWKRLPDKVCQFIGTKVDSLLDGELSDRLGEIESSFFFETFETFILKSVREDEDYYKYFQLLSRWVEHGDLEGGENDYYSWCDISNDDSCGDSCTEDKDRNTLGSYDQIAQRSPFRTEQACKFMKDSDAPSIPFCSFTPEQLDNCLKSYLGQQQPFRKVIQKAIDYRSYTMHQRVLVHDGTSEPMEGHQILVLAKNWPRVSRLFSFMEKYQNRKPLEETDYNGIWFINPYDPRLKVRHPQ